MILSGLKDSEAICNEWTPELEEIASSNLFPIVCLEHQNTTNYYVNRLLQKSENIRTISKQLDMMYFDKSPMTRLKIIATH
jgi:hypothetical protein